MSGNVYINENTSFEKIAEYFPYLIQPLLEKGIKVIVCGDVKWGTIGEEIEKMGLKKEDILKELNEIAQKNGGPVRSLKLDL
ncbi:hypothetical protein [Fervidobacterium nodosum]|uniref:DUF1858 domain-containing protein n=1 Tax=Fervidobacterium nodosum (strain ATCC 35602 / DSM 5306 / Rt17-B1) TaxID=381764 RepID=A7HJH1_FERNB|nr:hypothetical protein [Fervidobacterium nodosum]ABS60054.1 hypothetical protein Fnod_0187 [Fervidobacterium nodosum Rt17-B1]PHJ13070.1 hypothetical protein IM41_06495 [Fervidobacterium sp. SC_NGM5_G05]